MNLSFTNDNIEKNYMVLIKGNLKGHKLLMPNIKK